MKKLITILKLIKSKKEKEDQATRDIYKAYGVNVDSDQRSTLDIPIDIEWTPLGKKGEHFKSLELKQINSNRIELRKTKLRIVFSGVLTFIGISLFLFGFHYFDENKLSNLSVMGSMILGIPLTLAGIYYFIFPKNSTFDRRYDWYWVGKNNLSRAKEVSRLKKAMRLSNVAAIQVLTESYNYDDQNSYVIWEINLVSENGRRLNVIDIGDKTSILKEAKKLADFLNVPIWSNKQVINAN